jgi:hypothetical protein
MAAPTIFGLLMTVCAAGQAPSAATCHVASVEQPTLMTVVECDKYYKVNSEKATKAHLQIVDHRCYALRDLFPNTHITLKTDDTKPGSAPATTSSPDSTPPVDGETIDPDGTTHF